MRVLVCTLLLGGLAVVCAGFGSAARAEGLTIQASEPGRTPPMSAVLRSALLRTDFSAVALASRAAPAPAAAKAPTPFFDNLAAADIVKPFRALAGVAPRDLDCLSQAVYFEARGEPMAGQAAVAQVVLNRVRHPAFPKSVCGVVFQRAGHSCQFSWACKRNDVQPGQSDQWRQARAVASRVMAGELIAGIGFATHFNGARAGGFGSGLQRVAQIGAHAFYRFNGSKGAAAMFQAAPVRLAQAQPAPTAAPRSAYASLLPLPSKADTQRLIASASAAVQHVAEAAQSAAHSLVDQIRPEAAGKVTVAGAESVPVEPPPSVSGELKAAPAAI